jgi:hypothetical protein
MSGTFYKALGFAVWKGGIWYARQRYGAAPKRLVGGLVVAGAVGAATFAALRRNGHPA